jgi:putative N-acetylmannosamine-6-phosphate epimerase
LGADFEPWVKPVMEKMLQGARQAVQVKAYDGTFRDWPPKYTAKLVAQRIHRKLRSAGTLSMTSTCSIPRRSRTG